MQRKFPLERNAPSQLLLPTRLNPCPPADPTKSGRGGSGEIGTEIVPKGSQLPAANRGLNPKARGDLLFRSRIPTS